MNPAKSRKNTANGTRQAMYRLDFDNLSLSFAYVMTNSMDDGTTNTTFIHDITKFPFIVEEIIKESFILRTVV
ncbi:hypothetical protein HYD_6520 [Candidatus Hydrogenosomobacter endosymbioticus]|uniref:Uncharacterized protein n=1 Tax=Candidatus Hydrogenosomobacter endosymbioticus TaxID=2558174 RepID=A0ABM7V9P7_9PROT|nr:hypothetical protein HYD_6520 [Candidatus Hydrogenosomobacter endosymbioticus]